MTLLYCFGSNALDPYEFMNALDMMLRIPMSYKCFVRGAQEPYESINSKSQTLPEHGGCCRLLLREIRHGMFEIQKKTLGPLPMLCFA